LTLGNQMFSFTHSMHDHCRSSLGPHVKCTIFYLGEHKRRTLWNQMDITYS